MFITEQSIWNDILKHSGPYFKLMFHNQLIAPTEPISIIRHVLGKNSADIPEVRIYSSI